MITWQKVIEHYNQGIVTQTEMRLKIFEALTEDNVRVFLNEAPKDVLENVLNELEHSPRTDEEWEGALVFCMGSWLGDGSGYRKAMDKMKADWRRGVETLRRALGGEWNT